MMEIRIAWEPENLTPLDVFEARLTEYVKDTGGVTLLRNGTMLFIKGGEDDEADAKKVMQEAKFFTDFSVKEMKEGGYFVVFHDAVAVYVSAEEFLSMRSTIISRIEDLKLPDERVLNPNDSPHDHYLIGLYGRGKLYRDVFDFRFFKRLDKLNAG
jgi:hypothetical protein